MSTCTHSSVEVVLTPELTHHGKRICTDCRRFLGWAKKPETVARQAENARHIVALRKRPLPQWEHRFIESIDGQGEKLSPKQQATLDRIVAEYPTEAAV